MIPTWLFEAFGRLSQPRLFRPPCPNMLDGDGVPQGAVLAGVDRLIAESAVRQIMAWEMPTGLRAAGAPTERWRLASAVQKAIRFGDLLAAMNAAHALHHIDPSYLWRRLAICSMEDVFLGNLYAVAATFALVGDRASRRVAGELKSALWLTALLAAGWKDRTACNLTTLADFDRLLLPAMSEWKQLPDADLAAKASSSELQLAERMLAAWLLAGTKRFSNYNVPKDNDRARWSLMRLMVQEKMPLILYWMADRAARRGGECLFVSVLPTWQLIGCGELAVIELKSNTPPPLPTIDGLPSAVFDIHTREGKSALRKLALIPEIAEPLSNVPPEMREQALGASLFLVEGGRLNLRFSAPEIDAIHFRAMHKELEFLGLSSVHDQCRLMRAIQANFALLHELRAAAVTRNSVGQTSSNSSIAAALPPPHNQRALPLHQEFPQPSVEHIFTSPDIEPARLDRFVWAAGEVQFTPPPSSP